MNTQNQEQPRGEKWSDNPWVMAPVVSVLLMIVLRSLWSLSPAAVDFVVMVAMWAAAGLVAVVLVKAVVTFLAVDAVDVAATAAVLALGGC